MNFRLITINDGTYLECLPDNRQLRTEADALDLVAVCGEHGTDKLMVQAGCLPPEFYDLKTGLAGMILQKLTNYWITAAFIVSDDVVGNGRFYEMMIESNRGRQFHFCSNREEAENWLLRGFDDRYTSKNKA